MSKLTQSSGYAHISDWLASKNQSPFDFQRRTWEKYSRGYSGLVVAPTGFGKTFSVFLAVAIDCLNHPQRYARGLKLLWVSPLRSLANDLQLAMQTASNALGLGWRVAVRNGDTPPAERQRQAQRMPDVLIITPESLHLLMARQHAAKTFANIRAVAVDEWHELLGNKRGVMMELALSYLRACQPSLRIWGISATLGNLDEAQAALLANADKAVTIRAQVSKKLRIETILPDNVNELPWAGHLGATMAKNITPIISASQTTLIFTNTRRQAETWYQLLLNSDPTLAGQMAIHHALIDQAVRHWIERSLHDATLKAVVCTSSLDLGVDFQPVDTVIQIGSTKSLARLIQRAGRSGHRPNAESVIYLVPTHSLELMDMAALQSALQAQAVESRAPLCGCMDVLVQYLVTRALGDGFYPQALLTELRQTHAYCNLSDAHWQWALRFITCGGDSLHAYEQYHKVVVDESGCYRVVSKRIAMIHRVNIGTIVSDSLMQVKFARGGLVGMVEESFISRLSQGEQFILAGRVLQLLRIKDMTAYVKLGSGKAKALSWLGGRLPLSSDISHYLRAELTAMHALIAADAVQKSRATRKHRERQHIMPLMRIQAARSVIPADDTLLLESIKTRDGYHLFVYPFEGRAVHETLSALVAYRLSRIQPMSLTIASNDYGFELLSADPIPLDDRTLAAVFSPQHLREDITHSINATEMALRQFRDIAVIAGLVIQHYPRQQKSLRGLQASAGIIFNVFADYEPEHPLLLQAYREIFDQEIDFARLTQTLQRIERLDKTVIHAKQFTPLSFPIKVDSLRMSLSNEDLAKRIERLQTAAAKDWQQRQRQQRQQKPHQ